MSRTVSRLGQVNGANATDALFLKVFGGEVLSAFRRKSATLGRHTVRSLKNAKSAAFPATGRITAAYHTPGNEIVGGAINHNERVITADDLLVASTFIHVIDEARNYYEVRSEYSTQCGEALAINLDKNVLQVMALAARASATVTGLSGGTSITDADARTNADSMVDSLFDAAQALNEKDVPQGDRYAYVPWSTYLNLVNSTSKAIHKDYGNEGNGSIAKGFIAKVADIELVPTNNMPSTNVNTGPTAYQGNFTNTAAIVAHRSAVGTVKLIDLAFEMEYQMSYQGTMILAKTSVGHGILRPESAVEIVVA